MGIKPTYEELKKRLGESEQIRIQQHLQLESLKKIVHMVDADYMTLSDQVLTEILLLTQSSYAFYGFLHDDEGSIKIHRWTEPLFKRSEVGDKTLLRSISEAGEWADAVRKRKAIMINDYRPESEEKIGFPEWHARIDRFLSVPVFGNGKIIALVFVANKQADYTADDIEQIKAFAATVQILLGRKKDAEALHRSEERYRRLINAVTDYVFTVRIEDGRPVETIHSPACISVTGYTPKDFAADPYLWISMVHQEDRNIVQAQCDQVLSEQPVQSVEHRIFRKDGAIRWVRNTIVRQHDQKGNLISYDGLLQDITERKEAEEALKASEGRLRTIIGAAEDIALILAAPKNEEDYDANILEFSPGAEKIFGYGREEIIGEPISILHLPEDLSRLAEMHNRLRQGKKGFSGEITLTKKSGDKFTGLLSVHPLLDKKGKMYASLGVSLDISEQKRFEAQVQQVHKMESFSTLAGGIAHDFNNLLGVIMGYIELSKQDDLPGAETYAYLSEALKACAKARDLTSQFMTFSRSGRPIRNTGPITGLIKDCADLVVAGSNVECQFGIPDNLWLVDFDEVQMKQAFCNLIINAKEAMPAGGTIKIAAENVNLCTENDVAIKSREHIKITVQDEGVGIPKENLRKIFDPYFSTKEMGAKKGTGLGLTIVYSIIAKHNGHIEVESEIGRGSTFAICLPASEKQTLEERPIEESTVFQKGKVLVMDDEEMMRDVAGMMLKRMGYEVEVAEAGDEVIEAYRMAQKTGAPFDAVILDLTIKGGMGGKETIQRLLEIDPKAKVILASGYCDDPLMINSKQYGFKHAIAKPYSSAELIKALSLVITEKSHSNNSS